ncbi:hypothetical protein [Roseibium album]|uniref:hypothetical protein n=1 Tax=Roseibium album TaxID=311410 RepID=UPI00391A2CB2
MGISSSQNHIKELESEKAEIKSQIADYESGVYSDKRLPDGNWEHDTENIKADRRETIEILEEQIEREKKRR